MGLLAPEEGDRVDVRHRLLDVFQSPVCLEGAAHEMYFGHVLDVW